MVSLEDGPEHMESGRGHRSDQHDVVLSPVKERVLGHCLRAGYNSLKVPGTGFRTDPPRPMEDGSRRGEKGAR